LMVPYQIVLMNVAIFFGHYLIVSTALNFQYGNAGIPNMSNNISVACGAYVVSSVVLRISIALLTNLGVAFKPDWVYDNPYNASTITAFIRGNAFLGISFFFLSIALALFFGSILGWFLATISGKLRSTYLMMFLYVISSAGNVIAANNAWLAGGTMGAFVPNFLSWYPGENMLIVALATLLVGMFMYFVIRGMQNSPFGRLMRAVRENEWTIMSAGKNMAKVRREVMMFSSGMMAVTGVLIAYYYNFVQYQFYDQNTYTIWPWLMITMGGMGNNAGALIGVIVGVFILKGISAFNLIFGQVIANTGQASLFLRLENLSLGLLLIWFIINKPRGLLPEKQLYIPGINYKGLILKGGREPE
jgi:branched-chain amino acid transport system permease protein